MSFLDDEIEMLQEAIQSEISEYLFEEWINTQLDEGQEWADYQIALITDDNYVKGKYNAYYNLKKGDLHYVEVKND